MRYWLLTCALSCIKLQQLEHVKVQTRLATKYEYNQRLSVDQGGVEEDSTKWLPPFLCYEILKIFCFL